MSAIGHKERSRTQRGFSFLVIAVLPFLFACQGPGRQEGADELMVLTGKAQGTTFTIKYLDPEKRDLSAAVDSILQAIDRSLSLWDANSTVSRFNAMDTMTVSDHYFLEVLEASQGLYRSTQGTFDPTVLPVLRYWGMGPRGKAEQDTVRMKEAVPAPGMELISAAPARDTTTAHPTWTFAKPPGLEFDPNGIAQGYTVDVLAAHLEQCGIKDMLVEVGGEVRAKGRNERGSVWTIQIDKPLPGKEHVLQVAVPLENRSLATSGNYRKFIEREGRRYGHTIDPRTGRPAGNALLSASVIADDCMTADALGTALMVMGPDEAKAWLGRHAWVEGYLIMDDGQGGMMVWSTPGWPLLKER